jgi:hypothetical protein
MLNRLNNSGESWTEIKEPVTNGYKKQLPPAMIKILKFLRSVLRLPQINLINLRINWVLKVSTEDVGELTASQCPMKIRLPCKKQIRHPLKANMMTKSFRVLPQRL